uniref:Phosphoribulokinase/uridine kinase domain-containing protein n=1 Tax=Alexandrium monilatum TaxID=311494 RepID=A0A7S4S5T4_9DINO|mmetsp:Transcript_74670/g.236033  ORF Transcript_74670/g.236033 Transcript_74670/m.236033 type:complete len:248 (+) Transcript_74670:14-757(+)
MGSFGGRCGGEAAVAPGDGDAAPTTDGLRRVLLVGVGGPSCSGKSTLAGKIAERLGSPLQPVQLDWYFVPSRMPKDPRWGRNWETPEGVDFFRLGEDLHWLVESLRRVDRVPERLKLSPPCCHGGVDLVREGWAGLQLGIAEPMVVVAEGFLMFHNKAVGAMFDVAVWLEAERDVCSKRRHQREARDMDFELFSEWYREVVWSHFLTHRDVQLKNVPGALRLDAGERPEALLRGATTHCRKRLGLAC